jgi:amidase
MRDLTTASTASLAWAIREKQVSSEEVVSAYLARIAAINPALNAVVQLRAEDALADARQADAALARGEVRGPLHGVPFTVKDTYDVAGMICTCGTQGRAQNIAQHDATAVARLKAAGGIVLGLTNLPELCLAAESDNLIYGRTNNPYDLERTPGGSSGGEAATIAAGGSPLGLGTDSGGSVRIPAHFCGIAALKPTWGRVPLTGLFPPPVGTPGRIRHPGPLARRVEDLALALPILAGVDWRDPGVVPMPLDDPQAVQLKGLRAAFYTDDGLAPPTPETVKTVQGAAQQLIEAGLNVEEARPPGVEQSLEFFLSVGGADGAVGLQRLLDSVGTTALSPLLQLMLRAAGSRAMTLPEFGAFLARWDVWKGEMIGFMQQYDVLLSPVVAQPAPQHGTTFHPNVFIGFGYAATHNMTGWPAVVVRCGTSPEGLPIGVQIAARPWREDVALAVALHLETALGGWQPPIL